MNEIKFLIFLFFPFSFLYSAITIDFREPEYCDGVLSTEKGGVVEAQDIRIQAQHFVYIKKEEECTLEAEGDLILEFGDMVFVGDRIEYNFLTRNGIIYNGKTALNPWYFGGEKVFLCSNGNFILYNGFATTSETFDRDWQIDVEKAILTQRHLLEARNVRFKFIKLPLFWLPSFKINLSTVFDNPFKYTLRWNGRKGPMIGMMYEIFSWNHWKTNMRLDYRFTRGLGGGIETLYKSPNCKERFHSISYAARDISPSNTHTHWRYRLLGTYHNSLCSDKIQVHLTYDKLSDKEMATDYNDKGLELDTAKRTQLYIRRQDCNWIANFTTRYRVNSFQTIKQELPTLETSFHPFVIGNTGIISDNKVNLSYLDFEYGSNQGDVRDYNSTRYELNHRLYRPFNTRYYNFTPEVGTISIFYGNNPDKKSRWAVLGLLGLDLRTHFSKCFYNSKHLLTPYMTYDYLTYPTTSPSDHYIFDISDGLYRLNQLRFGIDQNVFIQSPDCCIRRSFRTDVYSYAFFDTKTLPQTIPKMYLHIVYSPFNTYRSSLKMAWDFQHNILDHYNIRQEWTFNDDFALSAEYRHRSQFDWKKVDRKNFILDSFRSIEELEDSNLSDRRDTVLIHLFWRFNFNWALEYQARYGWGRRKEPAYNEYVINLIGNFKSIWNVKISYRHKKFDDRFTINFFMGLKKPNFCPRESNKPYLEF